MKIKKSFEVVSTLISEMNKHLPDDWIKDEIAEFKIKRACGALDALAEDYGCKVFDVSFDDKTGRIIISLKISYLDITDDDVNFPKIIEIVEGFQARATDDGLAWVDFICPSVFVQNRKGE